MDQSSRQSLYSKLQAKGFDVGPYEEYDKKLNDPAARKRLYDAVQAKGFDIGDFATYESRVAPIDSVATKAVTPKPQSSPFGDIQTNPQMSDSAGGLVVPRPRGIANPLLQQPQSSQVNNFADIVRGGIATATMPVTGWATIPAMMASAGAGSIASDVIKNIGGTQNKSAGDIAKSAGGEALVGGALAAVPMIPGAIKRGWAKNMMRPDLPQDLYQSALRVPAGSTEYEVEKMVNQGLSDKIAMTKKDLKRLVSLKDETQAVVDRTINTGSTAGDQVDWMNALGNAETAAKDIFKKKGLPITQQKRIEGWIGEQYDQLATDYPSGMMPTAKAQELKKSFNAELNDAFSELQGAAKETQKQFDKAVRADLETLYPDIRNLNQTNSARIELEDAMRRVLRQEIRKTQIVPMSNAAAGGAAALIAQGSEASIKAGAAGTITYLVDRALNTPLIKSKLAIALDQARKIAGPGASGPFGRGVRTAVNATIPPFIARPEE